MTFGELFSLAISAMASMQKHGLLDAGGNLVKMNLTQEAEAISLVIVDLDPLFKAAGIVVPPQLDRLIMAAPAIISLATTPVPARAPAGLVVAA
jgi:hypothetical protein